MSQVKPALDRTKERSDAQEMKSHRTARIKTGLVGMAGVIAVVVTLTAKRGTGDH